MSKAHFDRLKGAALGKSVFENLQAEAGSKAFVEETVIAELKRRLSDMLADSGFSDLAKMIQAIRSVDITANKDVPLGAFLEKQIQNQLEDDPAQMSALEAAIETLSDAKTVGDLLELDAPLRQHPAFRDAADELTLGTVLETSPLLADTQLPEAFIDLYVKHKGPMKGFWSRLRQQSEFKGKGIVEDLQFTLQLGALTRNNPSLVKALQGLRQKGVLKSPRDLLLKLDAGTWKELISRVETQIPPHIRGETPEERIDNYASDIVASVRAAFPTTFMGMELAKMPEVDVALVKRALAQNPRFDPHEPLPGDFDWGDIKPAEREKAKASLEALRREIIMFPEFDYRREMATVDAKKETTKPLSLSNPVRVALEQFTGALGASDFDIFHTHIDTYFKEHTEMILESVDAENRPAVEAGLEGLMGFMIRWQRIARLIPGAAEETTPQMAEQIEALMGQGIHSAFGLTRVPRETFVARHSSQLGGEEQADLIYRNARQIAASNLNLFVNMFQAARDATPLAIGDVATSVHKMPSWKTLFGALDLCECEHCDSLYSPAAYLVDLLEFLKNSKPNEKKETPLQILLKRRPDLEHIKLTQENTKTRLPYIDLVNEILESYVALGQPDAAAVRNTQDITAAELSINPQYTIDTAYKKLSDRDAIYPISLPFNRPLEVARIYLEHLGSSRYRLMETFQIPFVELKYPRDEDIACEYLNISERERQIITGAAVAQPSPSWEMALAVATGDIDTSKVKEEIKEIIAQAIPAELDTLPRFFGYETCIVDGMPWTEHLAQVPQFLKRTGISYLELIDLLKTRFLNPQQAITLAALSSDCDLNDTYIRSINLVPWFKMHRFIRLWRKMNWSIQELDKALMALKVNDIDATCLLKLAQVKRLQTELNLPLIPLLSLWSNIDTHGENALYDRLFLNRAVLNPVDESFALKSDRSGLEAAAKIKDHIPAILAALRISGSDLSLIRDDAQLAGNASLNLANLSNLYRYTVLARALKLSIKDLIVLKTLTGLDPFQSGNPGATVEFMNKAQKVSQSGFTIPQLNYLYRHESEPTRGIALSGQQVDSLVKALEGGLNKMVEETAMAPDPTGELLRSKLQAVLDSTLVDAAMSLIDGSSTASLDDRRAFIDQHFCSFLDPSEAKQRLLESPNLTAEERIDYVLQRILAFLRHSYSRSLVEATLGDAFNLDGATIRKLFDGVLRSSKNSADSAMIDLMDPASGSTWPAHFKRLHKIALLVNTFKMTADELDYLSSHSTDFSGFDLDALPLQVSDFKAEFFEQWERLYDLFALRDSLSQTEVNLLDVFRATTKTETLERLAGATGWDAGELAFLAGPEGFNLKTMPFKNEIWPCKLQACLALGRRLGVSARRLLNWVWNEPDANQARDITSTVKAKYDDAVWPTVAKPLNNALRERCRTALVDYVLAQPAIEGAGISNSNQLFEHFLIDVDMSACRETSRIKQALSSVQLFVQRCLMNLEREVSPDALNAGWWRWMKNYRVWEANRKVFLYPENVLEPELRYDKSPFFKELETELLQDEVTEETAEAAFLNYLEKLDEVSRLEICGLCWQEDEADSDGNAVIAHVFGRTFATPHSYYYRRLVNFARWTPWEKVNLDIEGDHLIPVFHNQRLYLFWPLFEKKADPEENKPSDESAEPAEHWQIKLAWSEHKADRWLSKKITPSAFTSGSVVLKLTGKHEVKLYGQTVFTLSGSEELSFLPTERTCFFVAHIKKEGLLIYCYRRYVRTESSKKEIFVPLPPPGHTADVPLTGSKKKYELVGLCHFTGCHGQVGVSDKKKSYGWNDLIKPDGSGNVCMAFEAKSAKQLWFKTPELAILDWPETRDFTLLSPPQLLSSSSVQGPSFVFSYQDRLRTYFAHWTRKTEQIELLDFRKMAVHRAYSLAMAAATQVVSTTAVDKIKFRILYHPHVCSFIKALNRGGIPGLLTLGNQKPTEALSDTVFEKEYGPTTAIVSQDYPLENVDFEDDGAYSLYNWEMFFHIPLFIATQLGKNQRFEEAQRWFHYIFDPTQSSSDLAPKRYWRFWPFYDNAEDGRIQKLLEALSDTDSDIDKQKLREQLERQVADWRNHPFEPHRIARMRLIAYQKSVVMRYIDNLIDWGDQLFRRGSIESINEATQLYVLAQNLLGPRPERIPPRGKGRLIPGGLVATYYNSKDLTGSAVMRIDPAIAFNWGGMSPVPFAIAPSAFSVRWSGKVMIPHNEEYTFRTRTDDGVRLWVNGQLIIDEWHNQAVTEHSGKIELEAGELYDLKMEHFHHGEQQSEAQLFWESPSTPKEVVPSSHLYWVAETYKELQPVLEGLSLPNPLVQFENEFPYSSLLPLSDGSNSAIAGGLGLGTAFYFCIPQNEKMLKYWNRVADRLFKIRHCMDIEGRVFHPPLFEPPIDPSMLVRAAAAGVDIGSVLEDLDAPLPHYRFAFMLQKALELCSEVKSLGAALLSALEKKDAEGLALLRSTHELSLLKAVRQAKKKQIEEAKEALAGLKKSREVTDIRHAFYQNVEFMIPTESAQLALMAASTILQAVGQGADVAASVAALVPDATVGASGISSPVVTAQYGGSNVAQALQAFSKYMSIYASILSTAGTMSGILGGYQRRFDEWKLQERLAAKELEQIDKQILAGEIRLAIAEKELKSHDLQADNAEKVDTYMRDKYTNQELYNWMVSQISAVYFQNYQLAYDLAKRAEKAFRFERGLTASNYILPGYWESLKQGLLSGERLHLDLKRLELAYLDQNRREYEITKHISLVLHDSLALIALKTTGFCEFELPEALFDKDYPGHYMRRLKNVSLTIPCVTGPYTSVNCTLTLLSNKIRVGSSARDNYNYPEKVDSDDPRFATSFGAVQSIVTSTAQNDSGMFELNFRDKRYLPFEGAGVVSRWRIEMPKDCNAFDFDTIADVIIRLNYTAREGGEALRQIAREAVVASPQEGLKRMFSMKHEFPSAWHRFLQEGDSTLKDHKLKLELGREHFPFQFRGRSLSVQGLQLFLKLREGPDTGTVQYDLKQDNTSLIESDKAGRNLFAPYRDQEKTVTGLLHATPFKSRNYGLKDGIEWRFEVTESNLNTDAIDDLWFVCTYSVAIG